MPRIFSDNLKKSIRYLYNYRHARCVNNLKDYDKQMLLIQSLTDIGFDISEILLDNNHFSETLSKWVKKELTGDQCMHIILDNVLNHTHDCLDELFEEYDNYCKEDQNIDFYNFPRDDELGIGDFL